MKFLLVILCLFSQPLMAEDLDSWVQKQKHRSLAYLLDNISRPDTPRGFVVASPSKHDPDYYYHWVRDAALVMRSLDKHLAPGQLKEELFNDYIARVIHHQAVETLSGYGEPKFNPDSTGFMGPWGRPQNDGPALRAITLIHYLQGATHPNSSMNYDPQIFEVIRRDLDYTVENWREVDFDLWEEVKGTHFYTRMVQRTALHLGARLFYKMADFERAEVYQQQADELTTALENHWSPNHNYILSTINKVGGHPQKTIHLDTSVILAVNHAWLPGLSFGPKDSRVMKTYNALVTVFKNIYPINDTGPGAGIGRYPQDFYFGGNPWFLLTNAMAEYLYSIGENKKAEQFIFRTKRHMDEHGRMAEQFNRDNGYMLGARDLTWSYASFLTIRK